MPFLTVAAQNLAVLEFAEGPTLYSGDEARAFSNRLRSTLANPKRTWSGRGYVDSGAAFDTLRAATAAGAHVTASGDALGASVTVRFTLRGVGFERDGASFYRTFAFDMEEA